MNCEYCENEKIMMQRTVVNPATIAWVGGIKAKDVSVFEYELGALVDSRGYLRLVDLDDYQCLDHGKKIKISFCPFCGKEFAK